MSVNKAFILGNAAAPARIHAFPDGSKIATLSVATTESWKDAKGEWHESVDWHRVVLRGFNVAKAERVAKGSPVHVEGRMRNRRFTDASGVERTVCEIEADSIEVLARPAKAEPAQPAAPAPSVVQEAPAGQAAAPSAVVAQETPAAPAAEPSAPAPAPAKAPVSAPGTLDEDELPPF